MQACSHSDLSSLCVRVWACVWVHACCVFLYVCVCLSELTVMGVCEWQHLCGVFCLWYPTVCLRKSDWICWVCWCPGAMWWMKYRFFCACVWSAVCVWKECQWQVLYVRLDWMLVYMYVCVDKTGCVVCLQLRYYGVYISITQCVGTTQWCVQCVCVRVCVRECGVRPWYGWLSWGMCVVTARKNTVSQLCAPNPV